MTGDECVVQFGDLVFCPQNMSFRGFAMNNSDKKANANFMTDPDKEEELNKTQHVTKLLIQFSNS